RAVFFCSSRRRHTRFSRDWSSDVCSSDLGALRVALGAEYRRSESTLTPTTFTESGDIIGLGYSAFDGSQNQIAGFVELLAPILRSEERRVGKEVWTRVWMMPYHTRINLQ